MRGDLTELAADLVRLEVAVIVTESTPAALAAKQATQTIPIVTAASGDPVAAELVASLARPGGNVTGVTTFASELSVKRLELRKEAAPQTTLERLSARDVCWGHGRGLKSHGEDGGMARWAAATSCSDGVTLRQNSCAEG